MAVMTITRQPTAAYGERWRSICASARQRVSSFLRVQNSLWQSLAWFRRLVFRNAPSPAVRESVRRVRKSDPCQRPWV